VGDDDYDEWAQTASTGRNVERNAADTSATVSLDPEAEEQWQQHLQDQWQRSQPDPWAVPDGPSLPPGDLDEQDLRDAGAKIIEGVRQGIESLPGGSEILHTIVPRPLVSETSPVGDDDVDVLGVASMAPDDAVSSYAPMADVGDVDDTIAPEAFADDAGFVEPDVPAPSEVAIADMGFGDEPASYEDVDGDEAIETDWTDPDIA
jgi:hypothetical protein